MIGPIVRLSAQALWANKLRSGLTLLGVIVGVTSVMTIISALEGMMQAIESDLARLGPTTFIVTRFGIIRSDEEFREAMKRKPLDSRDARFVEDGCELCETMSMQVGSRADVKYRNQTLNRVYTRGAEASYLNIVDIEVAQGRFHSIEDDLYRRQVAFIGEAVREEFFEGVDPIGKEIRVGGHKYTVIGIAKKQGSSFGQNRDGFVIMPYSSFVKNFGDQRGNLTYVVKAASVEQLTEAQDEVRLVLRSRRQVPPNKPDDFAVLTANDILNVLNQATKLFRLTLVGVSSISLVVGGIVVMNIMMVSVTERTREIGIRKSVGAKRRHILLQFLFEALMTTLGGGLIGIVAGFLIARSLVGLMDMEIQPSMVAIFAGLAISTGTGVIFGIYPAMKASRLDPIKALSYE